MGCFNPRARMGRERTGLAQATLEGRNAAQT
jgi:hypothetical protein